MFRKSWNGPSLGELQAQPPSVGSEPTPSQPQAKRISSIGFWLIGYVLLRALIAGLIAVHSGQNAGHTQADMDRDLARWKTPTPPISGAQTAGRSRERRAVSTGAKKLCRI